MVKKYVMKKVIKTCFPVKSSSLLSLVAWMLVMSHYHVKMNAVFCREELDSENGISSFSLEQIAICDNLVTAFSYDIEESNTNAEQGENVTAFAMQQRSLYWNRLLHTLWRYLNR